jgi:hypothetical protein
MPSKLVFHEGRACDAVIRRLEARAGCSRAHLSSPKDEGHAWPVELVCEISNQIFALEHTGIEPFEGHVKLSAIADVHFRPIEDAVRAILPLGDFYQLEIPALATHRLKLRELCKVQRAIVAWAVDVAPTLFASPYARRIWPESRAADSSIPFDITLVRFLSVGPPGTFSIRHVAANVPDTRKGRIRRAYEKKASKLAAWRNQANARSVLIFEENDIRLTNAHLIG